MANGTEYSAQFNSRDREQLIETKVRMGHVENDLHEHKIEDNVRFKSIDDKFTLIRQDLATHAKYIYMMLGGLIVIQIALKFWS